MSEARFVDRHIGPRKHDVEHMLSVLGYSTMESFTQAVVPEVIRWNEALVLPPALSEAEVIEVAKAISCKNNVNTSLIGMGYYNTHTPSVIKRNILENPAWYTAYTPYQPEISQGRLEALINFQTMIEDLTGLPVAGASLLDEPTAVAEAMTLSLRQGKKGSAEFLVDQDTHPQTLAVLHTRAKPLGIAIRTWDAQTPIPEGDFAGVVISYPGSSGNINNLGPIIDGIKATGAMAIVTTDLLALTLIESPGSLGADIVVGSAQRFGVPMGFGGPHAGFMSVRSGLERSLPGRLVGVSVDADGAPAYRLALQTREQHIRREKATSNICTAQVLLAIISGMYAAYHGPQGLAAMAGRVNSLTTTLAEHLSQHGYQLASRSFFDTITITSTNAIKHADALEQSGINVRRTIESELGISLDETSTSATIEAIAAVLTPGMTIDASINSPKSIPQNCVRTTSFLAHPVFNTYLSETAMLRYLRKLSDKDVALDRSMIPLGSCTMKLNATVEMEPITWPEFANIHPFAPLDQAQGYLELIRELESFLVEITGYDAVSLQPNAGSQGEFAGLLAIKAYLESTGQPDRDICLIPSSAHGTNAASAVMAGMRVVVVSCDQNGNVDLGDLKEKLVKYADEIAALMITYPSTHGVFETAVADICELVHDAGGQVYVDGANLNALVGVAKPGKFGADVSHLNLHKTFCIPHGGGGPGVGPVGVRAHLAPFCRRTHYALSVDQPEWVSQTVGWGRSAARLGGVREFCLFRGPTSNSWARKVSLMQPRWQY